MTVKYKIYPLGENALTVDFGNRISAEANDLVITLSKTIKNNKFKGFREILPAYSSLTVFYDVAEILSFYGNRKTAFQTVEKFTESLIAKSRLKEKIQPKTFKIPVSFDQDSALDLGFILEKNSLSSEEFKEIFLAKTYRVFMLGFLPGFAYLGELDKEIAAPRRKTPRTKVPKGSVGIAGRQTGVYPLESPGGWQIIGRTEIDFFTPDEKKPTLLNIGDSVKFIER